MTRTLRAREQFGPVLHDECLRFLQRVVNAGDTQLASLILSSLGTLVDEIQVREMFTILAGKAPTRHPAIILAFARAAQMHGGGSFLDFSAQVWQDFADCEAFPSPIPRWGGPCAINKHVPHLQEMRKRSLRHIRDGLEALRAVKYEGLPQEEWPPGVRTPTKLKPLPKHRPSFVTTAHVNPLTPAQHERLSSTYPRARHYSDELQSATIVQTVKVTKYRPSTFRALQGKHCVWENGLIVELNPRRNNPKKKAGPQSTMRCAEILTQHAKRFGITPDTGFETFIFQDIRTGGKLQYHHGWRILKDAGVSVGNPSLTATRVRKGSMTRHAIQGLPLAAASGANDHSDPRTDWDYIDPQQEEEIYEAICLAAGITATLTPGCCKECGETKQVATNLFCADCDPSPRGPTTIETSRHDAIIDLALELADQSRGEAPGGGQPA